MTNKEKKSILNVISDIRDDIEMTRQEIDYIVCESETEILSEEDQKNVDLCWGELYDLQEELEHYINKLKG